MITFIGTIQKGNTVLLYYTHKKGANTFFKVITSNNGFQFSVTSQYVFVSDEKKREEKRFDWKKLAFIKQKETYYMVSHTTAKIPRSQISSSTDLLHWTKKGELTGITEHIGFVSDFKDKNRYAAYGTEKGKKSVYLFFSGNVLTWKKQYDVLSPRENFFDNDTLNAECTLQTENGILLLYSVQKEHKNTQHYEIGGALFDKKNPAKLLWRSETPLWESKQHFTHEELRFLGAALINDQLILYTSINGDTLFSVTLPLPGKYAGLANKDVSVKLNRSEKNPILTPRSHLPWESQATFNTAAIYEDGKVHFVYRAVGNTDLSVLGYATSKDGVTIDERSDIPIYVPRESFEMPPSNIPKNFIDPYASGGGYGGCEDPRITKIDGRFYMTYVAHVGGYCPRVALTSISVDDFLAKKWNNWEKPKLISSPGMVNKNAVIFPEKINGKYVVFHRVYPNVLVDYVDDLNFDSYLRGDYFIPPRRTHWDSKKIGAGAPPIKTKDGWLFVYQSVGYQDSGRYKIGAMLLDLNNPTKVLYRANQPLIEPNEWYENAGKPGVVYPCGAVVKDGKLLVYYGGADTVVCAASEYLDTFLDQLKYNQEPKLKRVAMPMIH